MRIHHQLSQIWRRSETVRYSDRIWCLSILSSFHQVARTVSCSGTSRIILQQDLLLHSANIVRHRTTGRSRSLYCSSYEPNRTWTGQACTRRSARRSKQRTSQVWLRGNNTLRTTETAWKFHPCSGSTRPTNVAWGQKIHLTCSNEWMASSRIWEVATLRSLRLRAGTSTSNSTARSRPSKYTEAQHWRKTSQGKKSKRGAVYSLTTRKIPI